MARIALRVCGEVRCGGDVLAAAPDGTLVRIGRNRRLPVPSAFKFRGLQMRVSARLGVTRSVVSRVMNGLKRSKRIEKALAEEAQRMSQEVA